MEDRSATAVDAGARPDNLAYIMYTSGSTGSPKGVLVTHRNAVASTTARLAHYREPVSAFLLLSSIAFDSSVAGLFWTLASGGLVVIPSQSQIADPLAVAHLIEVHRVSHTLAIPALYRLILEEAPSAALGSLHTVVVAGETCPPGLVRLHRSRLPGARLVNEYGPTEGTVWATAARLENEPLELVPIGDPVPFSEAYVLDRDGNLVPPGIVGELYLGGEGVARGYLNLPGLTADRFLPDGFSDTPGRRLYRTGDLVRHGDNGQLRFVGRRDRQIKIRGVRVEMAEIEEVLASHPEVREAAATVVGTDAPRVEAFIVPSLARRPPTGELRRLMAERLPLVMRPTTFQFVPELPRLPNGKVDYLQFHARASSSVKAFRGPRTPTEFMLAATWLELLGGDRIDVHTTFFEAGGHSLMAARVLARVRNQFGVDLPLRVMFEAPSIASLGRQIDRARQSEEISAIPAVVPLSRERRREPGEAPCEFPPSFAQERLWFLDRLNPGSSTYNVPTAAMLTGNLDTGALLSSIRIIIERHESLRTSLDTRDGKPVQRIWAKADVPVRQRDLRSLSATARRSALTAELASEARAPFDLARAPLLRILLLRLADNEHALAITSHHVVADGWSLNVFYQELAALYAARVTHARPLLPPLPLQYADYAVWQRRWLHGSRLQAQVAYWKHHLEGALFTVDLPSDRPRPPVPSMRGDRHTFTLEGGAVSRASALCSEEHLTPFMLLGAAFAALIHRETDQDDLTIGTPIAGRGRPELETLIGCFVNLLVLRVGLADRPTFRELMRRVRTLYLDADAHHELPFEQLVDEMHPARDVSRQALFQLAFAVQNTPDEAISVPGLTITRIETHTATSKFDMTTTLTEADGVWQGCIEYSTDLFDRDTIARLARRYVRFIERVTEDPDQLIDAVPLLEQADEAVARLLAAAPAAATAPAECLHEAFARQAQRTPLAVAVTFERQSLTYAALDRAAARLARELQRRGVGPDRIVALCIDPSLELVVALLAVLKAGGAYLPLDPDAPTNRLNGLLRDTATALILTSGAHHNRFKGTGASELEVSLADTAADEAPPILLHRSVRPDNLAYVICTSGSTGSPKGVQVTHANVIRLFSAARPEIQFKSSDVWTLFHSAAFDFSVWEIWGAWLHGGRVVIVSREVQRAPADFHRLLVSEEVTVLNQTPSAFRHLAHAALRASETDALRLRVVVLGGEAVDLKHLEPWFGRFGDEHPRVFNMYGITETTVHVTWRRLRLTDLQRPWASPIGRPLADLRLHVLDDRGQPVPIGVRGELYVGGPGLARGYLNRPDLTADRFVPDPFASAPGARLYRTGDRARICADGEIEYEGRADHQIKVRGFRIEAGEIESALLRHPAVAETVVIGRSEQAGDTRLVAYLVPANGEPLGPERLRAWLSQWLPDYMLPAEFIVLEALPKTAGGKIDRARLPASRGNRPALEREYAAPRDELDETFVRFWADVLQLKNVGIDDNFFSLGGNSLLLARLHSMIEDGTGETPRMVDLFKYPTVRTFTDHLRLSTPMSPAVQWGNARAAARRHAGGRQSVGLRRHGIT
jgi:amino acid adenylation domain-containing protein